MHKGRICGSLNSAPGLSSEYVLSVLSKLNSSMEGKKPNRPCTSKEKSKKHVQPKKQSAMPYVADSLIIPRVKQYMEDHNHSGSSLVDVDEMVDELRVRYPEYGRRKRGPFKQGVRNAFDLVYETWGMKSEMSDWGVASDMSDEEDISSASDKDVDMDDEVECDRANEQMMSVYMRQQASQNKRKRSRSDEGEKELINISSDEEVSKSGDTTISGQKSQNGTTVNMVKTIQPTNPTKVTIVQARTNPVPVSAASVVVSSNTLLSATPKKKKKWKEIGIKRPSVSFKSFGGSTKVIEEVCKLLIHVRHPEVYKQIGITPPRGFLLHGPPGSGKTLLANAIAGELGIPLMNVAGPELVAGVSGESEERIRDLFEQAAENAPCILFLDEVDAVAPSRHTSQREMEKRMVAQLLSCLDELSEKEDGGHVVVIGATNRPDSLDPALRRAGRFDREVSLGIPDKDARADILKILCSKLKLGPDFNYEYVAKNTPGFVGADLMALTREASMVAVNRVFGKLNKSVEKKTEDSEKKETEMVVDAVEDEMPKDTDVSENKESDTNKNAEVASNQSPPHKSGEINSSKEVQKPTETVTSSESSYSINKEVDLMIWLREDQRPLSHQQLNDLFIELDDFKQALKCVQPSAKREGFATVPDVTWDDVGSLRDVREELQMTIMAPVRHPEQFAELGISTPSGVLLCGPPGCGKTLLAKAVANEAGINFISVKGPELLNMYVGESEKAVRQCFQRGRNSAPCVIFFDELDALCPKRSDTGEGGASMRVVNQMLTEMDGIECRKGVFLMAASNRPEIIDPAVLRPGRLDKILYIGLPSSPDRVDILKTITKNGTRPALDADVDLKKLGEAEECSGFTGADLAALVREAGIEALKEFMSNSEPAGKLVVSSKHFSKALKKIRPSITEKDQQHYEKLQKIYSSQQT